MDTTQLQVEVKECFLEALMASEPQVPDYTSKLSRKGRRMTMLELRKIYTNSSNLIVMNQGNPNPDSLSLDTVTFTLKSGETIHLDQSTVARIGIYGTCHGIPGMHEWLMNFQKEEHHPPQLTFKNHPSPFDLTLTCGSMAGLRCGLEIIIDEFDTMLTEDIVYASVLGMTTNHGGMCQGVPCDSQGMIPEALDDILTTWTRQHPGRSLPKILYVIPYGNNPTGYNWSEKRIIQIYLTCRKHDLLIFDDGAYHFLRWGKKTLSFQSIDVDGRVLRFDTFSKTLGAGHRIGWVSGPKIFIDKVCIDCSSSYLHPSSLSQHLVLGTLQTWGKDRFKEEMQKLSYFYQRRADCLIKAATTHLKGLALCRVPAGGMFLWVDVLDVTDSIHVAQKAEEQGLIVVAGKFFRADGGPSNGLRMSFGSLSDERFDKAMEILADVIRQDKMERE